MQESTFNTLADLALTRTGLFIAPSKSYLVEARLSTILRREGFASCDDLAACLKARPNPVFEAEIAAALQSRTTWFFRDREIIGRIVSDIIPAKLKESKAGRVKIWCAGISTGQEAYSLALAMAEQAQTLRGARIDLVATDICRQSLNIARAGTYGHFDIQRGLSIHRLMSHFEQLESGQWQINEDIRAQISFREHNLIDDDATLGQFDIIVCANVLSGMSRQMRGTTAERLVGKLLPGGALILGQGESLSGVSSAFEPSRSHRGVWDIVPPARRNVA